MYTLSVSELTKAFDNKSVLDYIALECKTSEIVSIFGRNGSGKSTILKILFGTLKADRIRLSINGKPLMAEEVIPQQKIAYLPQDSFLPKSLKVRDVVPLYYDSGEMQDKILYAPGMTKIAATKVGSLSMGELRYFELLLVGNLSHPFLMLDEPFSMIEPLFRDRIKEFLFELKATKGIILTDHYYNDVLSVADRNLLLKNGRLVNINNKEELTDHGYLSTSTII
ncbi:Lipopolysaccharide export system ATP-binding protein LptB [compost metagenome]